MLYDGLDEIADIAQRNKMVEEIVGLADDYPCGFHVLTCRIAAYSEITTDMASFAKYTIDDMDEEQRREFIDRWYEARSALFEGEDIELDRRILDGISA